MVQITANGALPAYSPADNEGIFVMSTGALVAIIQAPASGTDQYAVSTDSGATWAIHAFPAFPGAGSSLWRDMGGTAVYAYLPAGFATLNTSYGEIHQFGIEAPGTYNDQGFYHRALPFNPSTNTLGIPNATGGFSFFHGGVYDPSTYGSMGGSYSSAGSSLPTITPTGIAVVAGDPANAASGGWFIALQTSSNIYVLAAFNDGFILSGTVALNYSHGTIADMHLRSTSSGGTGIFNFLLTFTDAVKGQLIVIPLHYDAFSDTWNNTSYTPEVAYTFSGSNIGHSPVFDASGKLDLIIRDGSNLYAVKRNGTGSYSPAIPLYSSVNQTTRGLATSFDVATGNLIVAFESTVNQANGEIYAIKRTAGVWGNPTLLAGGNADGYSQILMSKVPDGAFTPAILKHGAGVDYLGVVAAGPPFTPTVSSPAGNITSLTPVLAAPYVNPSPSDPQGFYQWQVRRTSDSLSFLDTGKTAGSSAFLTYAGTALVYGTPYQARVRYWDSISSSGSGTASGWSAWSDFTPVHGPVGTITSIVADATTIPSSPGTLLAPTLHLSFTYTQAESNSANSYRLKFYAADGVTLVAVSAAVAGTITAGSSVTTFDTYFPALRNSTVYKIAVETTDSVTGLSADGPQWQLTTAWAPPTTPTAFLVTPYQDLGTVVGTFTNDGTAVTNNMYYQRPNGSWVLSKSGALFTTFTARPPVQEYINYRVTAVGLTGIESLPATFPNVALPLRGNFLGVWITDIDDTSRSVAVGIPASWADFKWTNFKDRDAYLPLGGRFQKSKRGVEQWKQAQLKVWHPGSYILRDGSIATGQADVDTLDSMDGRTSILHYRDPKGNIRFCEMYAFDSAPEDPGSNFTVDFSLDEMMSVTQPNGTTLELLVT